MSTLDDLKKLMAAAEKPCAECAQAMRRDMAIERCGHQVYAEWKLKSLSDPIAVALVESQKALKELTMLDMEGDEQMLRAVGAGIAALHMDGLKKAMGA